MEDLGARGDLLEPGLARAAEWLITAKECCDVVHRVITSGNRGYSPTMPQPILSRLSPADLLRERLIGGIDISPDGSQVAYSERTVVSGKDRSSIWVVGFAGGRPRRLTCGGWTGAWTARACSITPVTFTSSPPVDVPGA